MVIVFIDSAFVFVSNEQIYTPTDDTIGGRIKLHCTPYRNDVDEKVYGRTCTMYLIGTVKQLPELKILSLRQEFSSIPRYTNSSSNSDDAVKGGNVFDCLRSKPSMDELRVMTYNILAEPYAISDYAKVLYYHNQYLLSLLLILIEKVFQLLSSRFPFD